MRNAIVWADIPVTDMDRARAFYSAILGEDVPLMDGADGAAALLPADQEGVGADLALGENQVPSMTGATVYLSGGDDLSVVLDRVEGAGGRVLMPKTNMGEMIGNLAFFADSEGNRIGLHSRD